MPQATQKLKIGALIALVVGSMIGGGIFSLPQNMAASASAGAVLIGWVITAIGMLTLAFVFQTLANRKPDLDLGIYAYAKAGFGDYMGFSSAWGYWISAWLGNVSYFVLLFSTLGYFFPVFGEGNTPIAIALACQRELGLPQETVNVDGGAIAHGHPIGASGAVMITRLLHAMHRNGERRGVVTLCIGGGQGIALALEAL